MPAKSAVAVGGDHELAVERNIHAPGWTGRCHLRPQRLAIPVIAAQRPFRAKDEALLVRRNTERAHEITDLDRRAGKLWFATIPVCEGKTGRVRDGKVVQLARRVSQLLGRQIEENWALAAKFEPEPDATTVCRKGEAFLIELITRVSLYGVPPEPALAVGANQSEGRAIRADRNVLAAGKEMMCRT
jgi:hypothetical protein